MTSVKVDRYNLTLQAVLLLVSQEKHLETSRCVRLPVFWTNQVALLGRFHNIEKHFYGNYLKLKRQQKNTQFATTHILLQIAFSKTKF